MDGFTLTGWQRRRLERQLREADDVPLYRRTAALLDLARGRSAAEVARTLGVSRQSIYNWVAAYAAACRDRTAVSAGGPVRTRTPGMRPLLTGSVGSMPADILTPHTPEGKEALAALVARPEKAVVALDFKLDVGHPLDPLEAAVAGRHQADRGSVTG